MKRKKNPRRPSSPGRPLWQWLLILTLITVPALVFDPRAQESFRLPKLLLAESVGLATLLILVWSRPQRFVLDLRSFLRQPAVIALLPMLAIASAGLLTSSHPLHVRQGLLSLAIGAACLVGWSLGLTASEHRRALTALLFPAAFLSVIAIGQFHGFIESFQLEGNVKERIALTSWAGGVFDLAGYLVLPMLIAQVCLRRAAPRWRWVWGLGLALGAYALALTQTLTAIAALLAGSLVLWLGVVPWRRIAAILGVLAVLGGALAVGIGPLRERIVKKVDNLKSGEINQLLSGRLDAWWAAMWMFEQHPWVGVGHGAYRSEFGTARLALTEQGYRFYRGQHQPYFTNAHSEFLEVLAEWGLPGLLALGWAVWRLLLQLRRRRAEISADADSQHVPERRSDLALMAAGVTALAVLSAANFPLRLALVGYPYLLLASWIFRPGQTAGDRSSSRSLVWLLSLFLAVALVFTAHRGVGRMQASRKLVEVKVMGQMGRMARAPLPYQARRLLEKTAASLQKIQELDPVEVRIPLSRGSLYALLGRPAAAIRAFDEALELERRSEIYVNLGLVHFATGDHEAAREAFRNAQRLNRNVGRQYRAHFEELGLRERRQKEDAEEGES